jgi:predicted regulator of amino acid metabolism with ACT domain
VQTTKLIPALAVLALSGCAMAPIMFTGISVGSVAVSEATGKSITDHTVSHVSGQDCRIGRVFRDQSVCQEQSQVHVNIVTTGVIPSTITDIEARYGQ